MIARIVYTTHKKKRTPDSLMEKTREDLLRENKELCSRLIALNVEEGIYKDLGIKFSESSKVLNSILNGVSDDVFLLDKDFKILWANKAVLTSTGCKMDEVVNKHCYKVTHHRDTLCSPPDDICPIAEVISGRKPVRATHVHYNNDGQKRFVEVAAYPISNEKNDITYFVHIDRDITEQVLQNNALKASETRYRAILNAVTEGLFVCDLNALTIVDANSKGCELFRYFSYDDIINMKLTELFDDSVLHNKETSISLFKKAIHGDRQVFEWVAKNANGELFWVLVEAQKITIGPDEERLLVIVRPVAGRKIIK